MNTPMYRRIENRNCESKTYNYISKIPSHANLFQFAIPDRDGFRVELVFSRIRTRAYRRLISTVFETFEIHVHQNDLLSRIRV